MIKFGLYCMLIAAVVMELLLIALETVTAYWLIAHPPALSVLTSANPIGILSIGLPLLFVVSAMIFELVDEIRNYRN